MAPALQRGLQRLAKRWNSRRALHVFRDETGLSTNPHLWSAIETALDDSDWFVLLASPESAASEWVNKEVAHWVATKPVDHILPVVTDGVWEWDASANDFTADSTSVPLALRGALREEARHLDLRWARNETDLDLRNSRFRAAIADLAAPMHGIAKDDLEGEDIRQQKRAQRLARGGTTIVVLLLAISLVFGALAASQRNQAQHQRNRADLAADTALTGGLASKAAELLKANQGDVALLLAVEANRFGERLAPGAPQVLDARSTLLNTLAAQPALSGYLEGQQGALASVKYSPDGKTIVSSSFSGDLRVWDAATRTPSPRQPPKAEASSNVAVNDAGLLLTSGRIWDLRTNQLWRWQVPSSSPSSFPVEQDVTNAAISDQGLLALGSVTNPAKLASADPKSSTLDLWNVNTGRRVGARITLSGAIDSVAFSRDGTQLGVDVVRSDLSAVDLVLVDTATGLVERRLTAHVGASYPAPGTAFQFSQYLAAFFDAVIFSSDGRQVTSVVGHAADGLIATFDTTTGQRLPTPTTKPRDIRAVSADLREVVDQTPGAVTVADTITDKPLASYTIPANAGTGAGANVALDPTRPNFVYQPGKSALAVLDWTQVGPPHFATPLSTQETATDLTITPSGRVVDLTVPLHQLIGGTGTPSFMQWSAAGSASGSVAILTDKGALAIWNPDQNRIERQLTGAPAGCTHANTLAFGLINWGSWNLAYVGTAQHGRIVLECPTTMQSWLLDDTRDDPTWKEPWKLSINDGMTIPYVGISNDTNTIVDLSSDASRVVDARTGKLRVNGPPFAGSGIVRVLVSPDARTMATIDFSGDIDLINTATGELRLTLTSSSPVSVADQGPPGDPEVAFSPDGNYFAAMQPDRGLELWDLHTDQSIAVLDGLTVANYTEISSVPAVYVKQINDDATRDMVVSFGANDDSVTVTDAPPIDPGQATRTVHAVSWSLRPDDWARSVCTIVGRDLTTSEWNQYVGPDVPYHRTCSSLLPDTHRP